jgi:NTE family protein
MAQDRKRALILSGGGGRGAYHCGVIEYLELIGWKPDILVGTSIGAINAAAIASGRTAEELKRLWLAMTSDRVQHLRLDLFNIDEWTYLFDNQRWEDTLKDDNWFDFDLINSPNAPMLAITATDVSTGTLNVFCNRALKASRSGGPRAKRVCNVSLSIKHIRASFSIPVVYPWTRVAGDDGPFWDGAVVSNTPLGTALRAGATEIIVVLLAPWQEDRDAYRDADGEPRALWALPGLALDWMLLSAFRSDLKLFGMANQFVAAYELLDEDARWQLARRLWPNDETKEKIAQLSEWRYADDPWIVAPKRSLPVEQIISYKPKAHLELFEMGRADAARSLRKLSNV